MTEGEIQLLVPEDLSEVYFESLKESILVKLEENKDDEGVNDEGVILSEVEYFEYSDRRLRRALGGAASNETTHPLTIWRKLADVK